jgi:hypothetical protein
VTSGGRFLARIRVLRAEAARQQAQPVQIVTRTASYAPQTSATRPPQPPQAPVHGYKALTGHTPDARPFDYGRDPGDGHRCHVHGVGWAGGPDCWAQGANGVTCRPKEPPSPTGGYDPDAPSFGLKAD